jgi:hypothetical protein
MIFHEAAYLHTVSCGTSNCQEEEEEEEASYRNKFCVDLKILYTYSLDLLRSREALPKATNRTQAKYSLVFTLPQRNKILPDFPIVAQRGNT